MRTSPGVTLNCLPHTCTIAKVLHGVDFWTSLTHLITSKISEKQYKTRITIYISNVIMIS